MAHFGNIWRKILQPHPPDKQSGAFRLCILQVHPAYRGRVLVMSIARRCSICSYTHQFGKRHSSASLNSIGNALSKLRFGLQVCDNACDEVAETRSSTSGQERRLKLRLFGSCRQLFPRVVAKVTDSPSRHRSLQVNFPNRPPASSIPSAILSRMIYAFNTSSLGHITLDNGPLTNPRQER